MANTNQLSARLRAQCESLRRKPTPLADLIPLLQQAADEHDKLVAALRAVIESRDQYAHQRERYETGEFGSYWSPAASMVGSEAIANARELLPPAPQES